MNLSPSIYDPLNTEYRLTSKSPTVNPSIGVEIESNLIFVNPKDSKYQRKDISNVNLPDSFDYEIDPSVVEFNGKVLNDTSITSLNEYLRSNLLEIINFAESNESVIPPFGVNPLSENSSHVDVVEDYLSNHPSPAYRKLMERDSGLTTLLTGSSSIQCHVEQTNFESIVSQNIAHSIFAPFLVNLFANSIVFDGKLTENPSSRMNNKLQMNFSGSLEIEKLILGPDQARLHFMELCQKMSSISPGYYLVRYFRPDLGTIENCTADFQLSLENFSLFVRFCREISLISTNTNFVSELLNFNPSFGSTKFLNFLTAFNNSDQYKLLSDTNFQFLISTLSDFNLRSDIIHLARNPQWKESKAFLENFGVNSSNPEINSDLMYNYVNHFYSVFKNSIA